jgi:predicted dehydrogenase
MLKIGLVGSGFIGLVHLDAFKRIKEVEIAGIVETSEEKRKELSEKFDHKLYSRLDDLLEKEDVDIIDICTPTHTHLKLIEKAAAAGKNIFCEKPLALNLEEAGLAIDLVEKHKVKAMVGHVLRFWPEYIKAKELVENQSLGKSHYIFCERLASFPEWRAGWGTDESMCGGVSIDLLIHDLDFMIWLFGKPEVIKSQGYYREELGGWSHIVTSLGFKNKVSGTAEAGWAFKGSFPFTMVLRILCENGTIDWLFRAGKNIEERGKQFALTIYKADGSIDIPEIEKEDPYFLELRYFIDCIKNNKNIDNATFRDGYKALEVAIMSMKSAKENKTIEL